MLFGGRRATTVPLVTESRSWQHGVFLASLMGSEKTAAAAGTVGEVRRDPFAMLPFCGYHMGDYFAHWLRLGAISDPAKLPKLYYVNWFRKDAEGSFLWPGYGENSRILKWVIERAEGRAAAVDTPIGFVPPVDAIDTTGLDVTPEALSAALGVDPKEWLQELPLVAEHYDQFGGRLPGAMHEELAELTKRLS